MMMPITLTVNLKDGTEQEFQGEINDFRDIRDFLNDQMGPAGLAPNVWSSIVVVAVNDAPDEPASPIPTA